MNGKFQLLLTATVYLSTVFGVMYYSGQSVEPILYDRFATRTDAIIIPVKSAEAAEHFYVKRLGFKPLYSRRAKPELVGITLPGKIDLLFEERTPSEIQTNAQLTHPAIRVRRAIKKLYASIESKFGSIDGQAKDGLTDLVIRDWGTEFQVADPFGNRLVFYQSTKSSGGRY